MALTEDQQAQVDAQLAAQQAQFAAQQAQNASHAAENAKHRKMEAIRIAQSLLVENRRLKTASDAVDLSASAVTVMAAEILTYVEG
jgi:hypothetical protein